MLRSFVGTAVVVCACHSQVEAERGQGAEAVASLSVPRTKARPVTDEYHGQSVVDPYRWLENGGAEEVKIWSQAQNRFARERLDRLPGRELIAKRVSEVLKAESPSYSWVETSPKTWFVTARLPPKQQPVVLAMPARGQVEQARVLVDPTQIDPTGKTHLDWSVPSPDGSLLALSLSRAGTERGDLRIVDVATGAFLSDEITHVNGGTAGGDLAWTSDSSGFFYTRYPRAGERPAADEDFYQQVYFHQLGTSPTQDRYEFGSKLPRIAENQLDLDPASGRVLLTVQRGDGGEFAHFLRAPGGRWRQLSQFGDKLVQMAFIPGSGDLFAISRAESLKGQLLRIDGKSLDLSTAKVIVPPGNDTLVSDFWGDRTLLVTPSAVYLSFQLGGPSEVRVFSHDGSPRPWGVPQEVASVGGLTRDGEYGVLVRRQTYLEPARWYRHDEGTAQARSTALVDQSPFDTSQYRVLRQFAVSSDGTRIPLNILLPSGAAADGTGACVVSGYGGYGVSLGPSFGRTTGLWLEQGVTRVVANLRGGGEYGEEWHTAGNLLNKQNVFDDFAAVLNHVVDKGYADPKRLGIIGGSNGGLLMGATLVQQPRLPKAVVSFVGLYDMLRVELSPNGAFNVTEFGTVKQKDQFKALYDYSPYHHVRSEVRYPDTLFITGENDPRVDPMHSRKMTARLQATAQGSSILLRTSADAGHGGGNDLDERISQSTDVYGFMFDALGVQPRR